MASGGLDNTIKLWDVKSGLELRSLVGHEMAIHSLAFSRDGKTLASGSDDTTIKLWDTRSGHELRTLRGHASWVMDVCFALDDKTLASDDRQTIKLWDARSGQLIKSLDSTPENLATVPHCTCASESFTAMNLEMMTRKIRLRDKRSGTVLCDLISIDEHDWLVVTPDGLFDGSTAAWNDIFWRFNNDTFNSVPVESFFSEFITRVCSPTFLPVSVPKHRPTFSQKDRRQPQLKLSRCRDRMLPRK